MHDAAFAFYKSELEHLPPLEVLELGSFDINGSVRDAYPNAKSWWGIDIAEGRGVDQVADATTYRDGKSYDVVVCAEAFEHTASWRDIIVTAFEHLKTGGLFVASCATKSRPPHSAFDGGALREGEYYENVHPDVMEQFMKSTPFSTYEIRVADGYFGDDDLYMKAVK